MRIFASAFCLSMLAAFAVASLAAAKPTDAQLSAIKANCRRRQRLRRHPP